MAVVRIPDERLTLKDAPEIVALLAALGIEYERWDVSPRVRPGAPSEAILAAYSPEIEALKKRGGYVTADVIDVTPHTPGLDGMLAKFSSEHWHSEDEVRFIVEGRGLFHIHASGHSVAAIEVQAGDLIRVPAGTLHWFDLCADRTIRAIRLFQDPAGWIALYTGSGIDQGYQPVCLGQTYLPAAEMLGK